MVNTDRGQLLLVGSIIIALVFVGLTVLLNSVIYTENVSGGSAVEVTGDITEFNKEARRSARGLTIRVNHARTYTSTAAIDSNLAQNFSIYSDRLAESYADTGSVYVNISHERVTDPGTRVVQRADDTMPSASPVFAAPQQLGWFVLNLKVSELQQSPPFTVKLHDTSGSTLTVEIEKTPGNKVQVNSSIDGAHKSSVMCQPAGGRVLLDLIDGTAHTGDCSFNATGFLQSPYDDIEFQNGGSAKGKLSVVVNGSDSDLTFPSSDCGAAPATDPCHTTVAWKIEITSRYSSTAVSYDNTQNVTVYDSA